MRRVLASLVLIGAIACGQSTTPSTAQSTEGTAAVSAGQETAAQAEDQQEAEGSAPEKLEEEQTEE